MSCCSFGLCGARRGNRQVRKLSLCIFHHFSSESKILYFKSSLFKILCVFYSSLLRIPLTKHKSMREALREKGIEVPYQDPASKYQNNEFSTSANMYINNYADVRNPVHVFTHYTKHFDESMGLWLCTFFKMFLFFCPDHLLWTHHHRNTSPVLPGAV